MHTFLRPRIVAVLLLIAAVAGLPTVAGAAPAARADTQPTGLPADPKASGYIGFCDQAGRNIVGGSVDTKPFAWKAVASTSPPKAFQGAGQNAVLNAYQPRPDTPPAEWSGSSLTAASFYSDRAKPAVQATYIDSSFADFMRIYPPKVNGLYVLRIYWGKRNYGLYSATYPTTTIQVQGARWHVVSGGTVDCGSATKAVSLEQLTGVASKREVTPRAPAANQSTSPVGKPGRIVTTPANVGAGTGSSAASSGNGLSAQGRNGAAATSDAASANSSIATRSWVLWSLVGAVVVLAIAFLLSMRGRRGRPRPAGSSPESEDHL